MSIRLSLKERMLRLSGFLLGIFMAVGVCVPAYADTHVVPIGIAPEARVTGSTLYITNYNDVELEALDDNAISGTVDGVRGIILKSGKSKAKWRATYSNAGYSQDGTVFDLVLDVTSTIKDSSNSTVATDGDPACVFKAGSRSFCNYGSNATESNVTMHLYKAGTTTPVSGKIIMYFHDLDVAGFGGYDADNMFAEGIELISHFTDEIYIGKAIPASAGHKPGAESDSTDGKQLNVSSLNGHRWVHSSHACAGGSLYDSAMAVLVESGLNFIWRGRSSGMGSQIRFASDANYPAPGNPTKVGSPATISTTDSVTFTVTEFFPDVDSSNKPKSIVFSDTFAKCLDVESATVKVERTDASNNTTTVTDNWTKAVDGQTLTLTAKDTSHNKATLTHKFTITLPVKINYDFNDAQLAWASSGPNLTFTNTAKVEITPESGSKITKTSNTVTETLTGNVAPKILLQKGDADLADEYGVGVAQGGTTLAGAKYTVRYWRAWTSTGTPTVTGTWTTDEDGFVDFTSNGTNWPYVDGDYCLLPFGTYELEETQAPTGYSKMATKTFQVKQNDSTGEMFLSLQGDWDFYSTSADTNITSLEPSINRGTITVTVDDGENGTAQGDGKIAGATVRVINENDNPIYYDGQFIESGEEITIVVVGEDGKVNVTGLPYGTYSFEQEEPSEGYHESGDSLFAHVTDNGGTDDAGLLHQTVYRGGIEAVKVDADNQTTTPQGSATLAGAKFEVWNRSNHEVIVNGTKYAKNTKVLSDVTVNSEGELYIEADVLPYGTYEIFESEDGAPRGYRVGDTHLFFQIREDGELVRSGATSIEGLSGDNESDDDDDEDTPYELDSIAKVAAAYSYTQLVTFGDGLPGTQRYNWVWTETIGDDYYRSADRAVAMAIRASGADVAFPCGSVDLIHAYMVESPLWEKVTSHNFGGSASDNAAWAAANLEPGDVICRSTNDNVFMYIGEDVVSDVYDNVIKGSDGDLGEPIDGAVFMSGDIGETGGVSTSDTGDATGRAACIVTVDGDNRDYDIFRYVGTYDDNQYEDLLHNLLEKKATIINSIKTGSETVNVTYNSLGLVTKVGDIDYVYDDDNRIIKAGNVTYTYDGKRLAKAESPTEILEFEGGHDGVPKTITRTDLSDNSVKTITVSSVSTRTPRIWTQTDPVGTGSVVRVRYNELHGYYPESQQLYSRNPFTWVPYRTWTYDTLDNGDFVKVMTDSNNNSVTTEYDRSEVEVNRNVSTRVTWQQRDLVRDFDLASHLPRDIFDFDY